jgi:hypothetical protein
VRTRRAQERRAFRGGENEDEARHACHRGDSSPDVRQREQTATHADESPLQRMRIVPNLGGDGSICRGHIGADSGIVHRSPPRGFCVQVERRRKRQGTRIPGGFTRKETVISFRIRRGLHVFAKGKIHACRVPWDPRGRTIVVAEIARTRRRECHPRSLVCPTRAHPRRPCACSWNAAWIAAFRAEGAAAASAFELVVGPLARHANVPQCSHGARSAALLL